ncbi:MAG: TonB-dependent receptor [Gemmatimonadota bacterium]
MSSFTAGRFMSGSEGRATRIAAVVAAFVVAATWPGEGSAQDPDTVPPDTTGVRTVAPLEVVTSVIPTARPEIGSGVPARISTLEGDAVEAWEPTLLTDGLVREPGVSSYDDLGSPKKVNLSTRGFTVGPTVGLPPGVTVFLDGVRQNEPSAQEVNFDLLPLEHVERVEVLRGTASLLGPNSLGGAINLVTERGGESTEGEIELTGGSFGTASVEGAVSGSADDWAYYAAGGFNRSDGWRDATDWEGFDAFVNLDHRGPERGIAFQAAGAKSRAETAGSLPASIFGTSPETNFTAGDFEDLNSQQISATGYVPVAGGQGSSTLFYRRSSADRFNVNQPPEPDVRSATTNHSVGGTTDWRRPLRLGDVPVTLRLGVDGAANWVDIQIFEEPRGTDEQNLTTDVGSPSLDLAGYALADVELGRVTLSAGGRYDYVRIPFEDRLDPAEDTVSTFHELSPRGGISVDLGRGASAHASVGTSFRAPAILELACADPEAACPLPFALGDDPPLDPVTATTYETGAQWAVGPAVLEASLYLTEVDDEIFFVSSEESPVEGFFTNLDDTRREGVELSADTRLGDGSSAYLSWSYTRATFQSDAPELFSIRSDDEFEDGPLAGPNDVTSGDRLPLVPGHQVKGGATVALPADLQAGVDARLTGEQWLRGDESNETEPLDAYFVADVRLARDFGDWSVQGIVNNVFDSDAAVFGTFNENGRTGELERFLTPISRPSVRIVLERRFGG